MTKQILFAALKCHPLRLVPLGNKEEDDEEEGGKGMKGMGRRRRNMCRKGGCQIEHIDN
jgi:hypothetical protein